MKTNLAIKERLKQVALLSGLDEDILDTLAQFTRLLSFQKGEIIFAEGSPADGFFFVARGHVKVSKYSPEGKEQILHIFGPNESVGDTAVLKGMAFPANCIALTDAEMFFIDRVYFINLITSRPQMALDMLAILTERLYEFARLASSLALDEAPVRLAEYLLQQSAGRSEFELLCAKGELAKILGMTPETVSRIFSRFKQAGWIRLKGNRVTIFKREQLEEIIRSV